MKFTIKNNDFLKKGSVKLKITNTVIKTLDMNGSWVATEDCFIAGFNEQSPYNGAFTVQIDGVIVGRGYMASSAPAGVSYCWSVAAYCKQGQTVKTSTNNNVYRFKAYRLDSWV